MQEFCSENGSSVLAGEVWNGLLEKATCGLGDEGFDMRLVEGEWDKRETKVLVFCVSFWVLCKYLTAYSSG